MTDKFVCIRFYPNMDAKYTIRSKEGMESWKPYNLQCRGGNALFINGEYVEGSGTLRGEVLQRVTAFCKSIQEEYAKKPMEIPGPQVETCAGRVIDRYHGYAGERTLPLTLKQRKLLEEGV